MPPSGKGDVKKEGKNKPLVINSRLRKNDVTNSGLIPSRLAYFSEVFTNTQTIAKNYHALMVKMTF